MLSQEYDVHSITPQSNNFKPGISITSIQLSKGLEFDEVLVPQVNTAIYQEVYDGGLLYIACAGQCAG